MKPTDDEPSRSREVNKWSEEREEKKEKRKRRKEKEEEKERGRDENREEKKKEGKIKYGAVCFCWQELT